MLVLEKYFLLLNEDEKKEEILPDKDDNFIHFRAMVSGETDFLRGIESIGAKRIQAIKFHNILSCSSGTTRSEVSMFIKQALRNTNNEYVILGYQLLDRKHQQFIIDTIETYKREKTNEMNPLALKLCLVGDSKIELLYRYANEALYKAPESSA